MKATKKALKVQDPPAKKLSRLTETVVKGGVKNQSPVPIPYPSSG